MSCHIYAEHVITRVDLFKIQLTYLPITSTIAENQKKVRVIEGRNYEENDLRSNRFTSS